jgi:hypothetical protein
VPEVLHAQANRSCHGQPAGTRHTTLGSKEHDADFLHNLTSSIDSFCLAVAWDTGLRSLLLYLSGRCTVKLALSSAKLGRGVAGEAGEARHKLRSIFSKK